MTPFTAAQEVAREWVTIDLLDEDDDGQARRTIFAWLEEQPRTREELADALEVLTMAVANTYENAAEFSENILRNMTEES